MRIDRLRMAINTVKRTIISPETRFAAITRDHLKVNFGASQNLFTDIEVILQLQHYLDLKAAICLCTPKVE